MRFGNTGTVVQTVIEVVGLSVWLGILLAGGSAIGAFVLLAIFLSLEHVVAFNNAWRNEDRRLFELGNGLPLGTLAVLGTTEAVLWAIWFVLVGTNPILGGVFLVVTLLGQHAAELNVIEGRRTTQMLFNQKRTVNISLIEAAIGGIWIVLVSGGSVVAGAIVLLLGLQIEHILQGRETNTDTDTFLKPLERIF